MKRRLIPFIVLTFVSLFAGLLTGNNVYYLFFVSFIFIELLSLISLFIGYMQFMYLQKLEPKYGTKGEKIELEMQIHNEFIMPCPMIQIEYDLPDDSLNLTRSIETFGIMHNSIHSIFETIYCRYRGKWQVGIKKATIHDVFGLSKFTLDFHKNPNYRTLTLIIKPRIIELTSLPLPYSETHSNQRQILKSTQDTAEISDIRKYQHGDILKKIHWKLTAAKRELLVKNYMLSYTPDTLLYIDCSNHNKTGIEAIILEDMIIECATAIANHLLKSYLPMKLITIDTERSVLTGNNPDDFNLIYNFLTILEFKSDFKLFDLLSLELSSISQTGSIFIITHTLDGNVFDNLIYLRQASVDITILLVMKNYNDLDIKKRSMITKLQDAEIMIIRISPDDNLNNVFKEHKNEK